MDDKKRTKIIDRVRKLLRLSESEGTGGEAENAASAAQELIERHRLDPGELVEKEEGKFGAWEPPLFTGVRPAEWRVALATAVAEPNGCEILIWERVPDADGWTPTDILVAGPKRDCELVHYIYSFLSAELERRTTREAAHQSAQWRASFRAGAINRIHERLMAAVKRARQNAPVTALVVRREAQVEEVRAWIDDEFDPEPSPLEDEWPIDYEAAMDGADSADEIQLPNEGQRVLGETAPGAS